MNHPWNTFSLISYHNGKLRYTRLWKNNITFLFRLTFKCNFIRELPFFIDELSLQNVFIRELNFILLVLIVTLMHIYEQLTLQILLLMK